MKKLFPVLLLLASLTLVPVPVKGSSAATILSDSGYLDSLGLYHVVGEVQNTGNVDVSVEVTAYFFDSENSAVSTVSSPTIIDVLLAGRKGPFDIILCTSVDITVCQQQSAMVHSYSLGLTLTPYQGTFPLGLEIISHTETSSQVGFMEITGLIKNSALGPAVSAKVIATYHNATGGVVATAFSPSKPFDIAPGDQATFDIVLLERTQFVAGYSLTAGSAGYGLISTFPFNSVLTVETSSTIPGIRAEITAYLRDENRKGIRDSSVRFQAFEESYWKEIGTSPTDDMGRATATYLPRVAGSFPVRASYDGDPNHSPATDTVLLKVNPSNTAPLSDFIISPASGDLDTTFTVDASPSSDFEDPFASLEVRWDWEGDGTWDTSWTNSKIAQHRYAHPSTYAIRLEVRDPAGHVSAMEKQVVVEAEKSSTPWTPNTAIAGPGVLTIGALIILSFYFVRRRTLRKKALGISGTHRILKLQTILKTDYQEWRAVLGRTVTRNSSSACSLAVFGGLTQG